MFKAGQKVVCIKAHSQGAVTVGKEYVVSDIMYCSKCGFMSLDVGVALLFAGVDCICGTTLQKGGDIFWISSRLFAPIEEISETTVEEFLQTITEPMQTEGK